MSVCVRARACVSVCVYFFFERRLASYIFLGHWTSPPCVRFGGLGSRVFVCVSFFLSVRFVSKGTDVRKFCRSRPDEAYPHSDRRFVALRLLLYARARLCVRWRACVWLNERQGMCVYWPKGTGLSQAIVRHKKFLIFFRSCGRISR